VRREAESKIKDYRVLSQVVDIAGRPYQIEVGQSLDAIEQLEQSISRFAVYLMLMISGIVLAIDVGFTHMVLRPLRNIIEKLQKVKKPENFDFSPVKTSTQEFRYLDESITEMMQKINEAFLKEKEFVGSASHEMLTPIAVLNSRFENMISDGATPEIISEKLVDSQNVLLRLNKIIKSLLLISKVEYNYYLKEDAVNIHELVEEIIEYSEDRMEARNITTKVEVEADFVCKNCNRSLLFTMLLNLVSNAIKYNREGGKIFVRSSRQNGRFILTIEDSGIGIPENELPHIFEGFKKLKTTEGESNRLGLHIVRSIANLHQIGIEVTSELEKGSVFTLRFPV
jgi:signal transduction histidine kinase